MIPMCTTLQVGQTYVNLHRDGRSYPLGWGTSFSRSELPRLHIHDVRLRSGDRLTFDPSIWQLVVDVTAEVWFGWAGEHQVSTPAPVLFLTCPPCPGCGTREAHEAEVPLLNGYWFRDRYVLRTCAACDASWEQEVVQ